MFGSMSAVLPSVIGGDIGYDHYPWFWRLHPFTRRWLRRINENGGSVTLAEITLADNLVTQIVGSSYAAHILYLLPFIGGNIKASIVPLIDKYAWGIPTNAGFVDADCGTALGLKNTTTIKFLDLRINAGALSANTSYTGTNLGVPAGMGYIERAYVSSTNTEPMGCYNPSSGGRFVIDLRPTSEFLSWGLVANRATTAVSAGNHHYYGETSIATLRTLYRDGVSVATNTVSDVGNTSSANTITLMGSNEGSANNSVLPYKGTCGGAYLTDGGLGSTNAAAFHTLLNTYLLTATGR